MNKERIKTNIILLLVLLILIGSIVMVKGKVSEKIEERIDGINQTAYITGFNDGQINFYNQMIISLSQNGEVILPIQTDNQTVNVRLVINNE